MEQNHPWCVQENSPCEVRLTVADHVGNVARFCRQSMHRTCISFRDGGQCRIFSKGMESFDLILQNHSVAFQIDYNMAKTETKQAEKTMARLTVQHDSSLIDQEVIEGS